jgi:CheY-like chemotaxis protein
MFANREQKIVDESLGQCQLDALPGLLAQWNVHVAGLKTDVYRAPSAPGPDAVVMADLTPLMAARELVAGTLQALDVPTDLPVIVLTTSADAERRTELLFAGADDCMSLPVAATELRARVARLVRVRERTRDLQELNRRLRAGFQPSSREPARDVTPTLRREGDYWTISYAGVTVRIRDCKGLQHLARLLAHPHTEMHALMLMTAPLDGDDGDGAAIAAGAVENWRRGLGNAGTMLDAKAKAAYRRRRESLKEMLDEARGFGDRARIERIETEMRALTHELGTAVGLGGRDRRAADAAERARINVTRTIKAAVTAIAQHHRPLAQHLRATVQTGNFSSYAPPHGTGSGWLVG